jgi:adenosine 3'-phospho 5'-phosphosulfate transporter B2
MTANTDETSAGTTRWTSVGWCVFYGAGIIGTLVLYGLLQERIMAQPYSGGEFFKYSLFLVLCNRIVAIAFCLTMIKSAGEHWLPVAPLWKYFVVSLSIVCASTCQYEALKYVSFPVQMLGKSFKMMPVMLWGMAISQKRYSLVDWLVAAAVTEGVVQFLLFGPIDARHNKGNSMYGLGLLVVFLFFDGLTSTQEEKLFRDNGTSKFNQMLYVNLGSAIISFGGLVLAGQLMPALGFVDRHPSLLLDAGLLSGSAVAGQFFIFSMVKEFGALVFAATMNVRQVVSVLMSYV